MAEAEDVIVDAARYATVFVRDLWQRHRGRESATVDMHQLLHRLDLVVTGVFGGSLPLRVSQPPAPTPAVRRLFRSYEQPSFRDALPATDGRVIWLPMPDCSAKAAIEELRIMALQQAARAVRGAAQMFQEMIDPAERSLFEVLEANAADVYLLNRLPGLREPLNSLRVRAASSRPDLASFPPLRRPLEAWVKEMLQVRCKSSDAASEWNVAASLQSARRLAGQIVGSQSTELKHRIAALLYRDRWIGQLRACEPALATSESQASGADAAPTSPPRSARLTRRPEVRATDERDEPAGPSPWMIQTAQPLEHAEDPFGMQRPADRDDGAADEFADSFSELPEARLISTPGTPREVLLSDDPPQARAKHQGHFASESMDVLTYPEWDWRARSYREPGASVHQLPAQVGPCAWVERTLDEHPALLQSIRRQFESLRAERLRMRQQADGEEIDIDACIDGFAGARAGAALPVGLYQTTRNPTRELAILLLIDVSGSTDGWVSNKRRVIDVEREALLLVCLALESLGDSYSVIAFSGEGARRVTVRTLKSFTEPYGNDIALRIAGLEPENYTRAGAALRHASAALMRQPARHRLLLMLSDGKPNDVDEYDGRYGVEDMRQAVVEARLQGIFPFCLTVDRHTASYLPAVFGEHQYAVLHRPELLPMAMVGWLKRLLQR